MKKPLLICEQCGDRTAVFAVTGRLLCVKCQSDALFEEVVRRVGWQVREALTEGFKQIMQQRKIRKAVTKDATATAAPGKKKPL